MIATIKVNLEGTDLQLFESEWEYLKANMEAGISAGNVD